MQRSTADAAAAIASARSWAEAYRARGAPLWELTKALMRPVPDVQRSWEFAEGRQAWLAIVDSLVKPHVHGGQPPDVVQGSIRKANGLLAAFYVLSLAAAALAAIVPKLGVCFELLAPPVTLTFLFAFRRRHFAAWVFLVSNSLCSGLMFGTVWPALIGRVTEQWSRSGVQTPPVAVAAGAMFAAYAVFAAALAPLALGVQRVRDPDESMMLTIGGSCSLQVVIYFARALVHSWPRMLAFCAWPSTNAFKMAYYCCLGLACACTSGAAWWAGLQASHSRPKEMMANKNFRCIVDRTPFGLVLVPERQGVRAVAVIEGSPAERVGVRIGDIIVEVAGQQLASGHDAERDIAHYSTYGQSAMLESAHTAFSRPGPFGLLILRT